MSSPEWRNVNALVKFVHFLFCEVTRGQLSSALRRWKCRWNFKSKDKSLHSFTKFLLQSCVKKPLLSL